MDDVSRLKIYQIYFHILNSPCSLPSKSFSFLLMRNKTVCDPVPETFTRVDLVRFGVF